MGIEEIKKTAAENSGKTRLPAASRIFLANQRRAGDETKKADIFFFISGLSKTLVKFSLCCGSGKVSFNFLSIIFNAQRITECKSKLKAAMATKRANELRIF